MAAALRISRSSRRNCVRQPHLIVVGEKRRIHRKRRVARRHLQQYAHDRRRGLVEETVADRVRQRKVEVERQLRRSAIPVTPAEIRGVPRRLGPVLADENRRRLDAPHGRGELLHNEMPR
jgi:hypothetical protein